MVSISHARTNAMPPNGVIIPSQRMFVILSAYRLPENKTIPILSFNCTTSNTTFTNVLVEPVEGDNCKNIEGTVDSSDSYISVLVTVTPDEDNCKDNSNSKDNQDVLAAAIGASAAGIVLIILGTCCVCIFIIIVIILVVVGLSSSSLGYWRLRHSLTSKMELQTS